MHPLKAIRIDSNPIYTHYLANNLATLCMSIISTSSSFSALNFSLSLFSHPLSDPSSLAGSPSSRFSSFYLKPRNLAGKYLFRRGISRIYFGFVSGGDNFTTGQLSRELGFTML
jgi:hypothetical protein